MSAMDYETENNARYEVDAPRYERDRSASPRPNRRNDSPRGARRSASPTGNGHADRGPQNGGSQDDGAINPGSNLFVTGIHPRLSETEVTRLFEKYGDVEKCQIMLDPHTKESRGFGFVKMVTAEQADAAKEGLQGEVIEGRTLSIEKARRARPRTPTPGKYFGPPKRDFGRPTGGRFGGRREDRGYDDRYDDRRRGGYRDEPYNSYRGYRDDRGGDRGERGYGRRDRGGDRGERGYGDRDRGDRDDSFARGGDRYGGGREDRYNSRGGGYHDRHERSDRDGGRGPREYPPAAAYGDPAPREGAREPYGGGERPAR